MGNLMDMRKAYKDEFEKVHVLNFCRLDWGDALE